MVSLFVTVRNGCGFLRVTPCTGRPQSQGEFHGLSIVAHRPHGLIQARGGRSRSFTHFYATSSGGSFLHSGCEDQSSWADVADIYVPYSPVHSLNAVQGWLELGGVSSEGKIQMGEKGVRHRTPTTQRSVEIPWSDESIIHQKYH